MLNLRDYQNATLEALRQGFAAGKRCQILYAPTGAGKTEMAIALLNATKQKGNKAAMILDRIILCDQTSKRLDRYNIDHGVLQSKHWRWRPYENIQVCSAQTLEKRGSFPGLNLLIVDECFPAGTIIKTPTGDKDISIVRCGDTVYNATGVGTVMGVMAKPANDLVKLEFEDGTSRMGCRRRNGGRKGFVQYQRFVFAVAVYLFRLHEWTTEKKWRRIHTHVGCSKKLAQNLVQRS